MADYINLQQTEVDAVQAKLQTMHVEILYYESLIREEVLKLAAMEGGFYISQISEKIDCLLDNLNSGPMVMLKTSFEDAEKALDTFFSAVMETDSNA